MTTLRLILADQLSHSLASLSERAPGDVILMCEVLSEASYVPHHPKKIAFLFASMRHFAAELREQGCVVRYIKLDAAENSQNLEGEVRRAIQAVSATRLVLTKPGEYRVLQMFERWQHILGLAVDMHEDDRFLCSTAEFRAWSAGRKQLRMEYFYRDMRRKYRLLLEADGTPCGGQWNFDRDNRAPPPKGLRGPKRISHAKNATTHEVLALVKARFSSHFGKLEPFFYALTRTQALMEFEHFITQLLPHFGTYQDAMVAGEPYLYHALMASYLNAGLLHPLEMCERAQAAYRAGNAPLNAVEGFIRQILGWREYVRGIYWTYMPHYAQMNALDAHVPLPEFYWTGQTKMACLAEVISHTREHAYSHHIQRLMVTGNFALLAGLDVQAVQQWYLAVYSDAYEWVEMPNTLGMALYGDGGLMASKPYAASGAYINRMSNFCAQCRYDPKATTSANACPFNALYWDFFARNRDKLSKNNRLANVYATLNRFSDDKRAALHAKAQEIHHRIGALEI
jgi:deoxyribodipyrimidine photolyase-related protein